MLLLLLFSSNLHNTSACVSVLVIGVVMDIPVVFVVVVGMAFVVVITIAILTTYKLDF